MSFFFIRKKKKSVGKCLNPSSDFLFLRSAQRPVGNAPQTRVTRPAPVASFLFLLLLVLLVRNGSGGHPIYPPLQISLLY